MGNIVLVGRDGNGDGFSRRGAGVVWTVLLVLNAREMLAKREGERDKDN